MCTGNENHSVEGCGNALFYRPLGMHKFNKLKKPTWVRLYIIHLLFFRIMVLNVGSANLIQYLKYVITGRKSIRFQLIGRGSLWISGYIFFCIFEMKLAIDNFE